MSKEQDFLDDFDMVSKPQFKSKGKFRLSDVSKSQPCTHEFDIERPVCVKCGWNRYYSKPTY